ncbi:type II CAAX endopeptidase family protein [Aliiglaciecola litoralis]|uniref:Type II CAAX endopeptidase family protein n=1 Tax=Aliiglaciecola litoralis TaxID=582857 RepID=A0ABP3WWS7_9ALTE
MTRNPPGFLMAVGILFCWFAMQFIMGMLLYGAFPQLQSNLWLNLLINGIATVVIVQAVLKHTQYSLSSLFDASPNQFISTATVLFPLVGLTVLGSLWWFADLQNWLAFYLPEDEAGMAYLVELMSGGLITLVALSIFAPVVEEVIFRGIILRGFLHHYPAHLAIVLSATLFAVFHFNLYQFLAAFVLGIFFGWLYYKTRSLWPCIFGHSCYNTAAYLMYDGETQFQWNTLTTNLFTFSVSVAGVYLLSRILHKGMS